MWSARDCRSWNTWSSPWQTTPVWRLRPGSTFSYSGSRDAAEARVRARVAEERVQTLNHAVRRITQRVNLFEKILIPTAKENIQRIRIYLGDAERAAVVTSKLAKSKQQSGTRNTTGEAV